jgi:hypothetical protein
LFSPLNQGGQALLWLLLGVGFWLAPPSRPAGCTPWGEPADWGGSLRCGFSPLFAPYGEAIVRVRIQHPGRARKAAGFRIAEDLILTAAHTLRHPEANGAEGEPLDVTFFDADGSAHRVPVREAALGPFNPRTYRSRGDWALLKIDPPRRFQSRIPLGAPCGGELHLPSLMAGGEPVEAVCKPVELAAYPYNKSLAIWTSCDAANGMSGSPIVEDRGDGSLVAVGVLSLELAGKPPWSFGPVITPDLREAIARLSDYEAPPFRGCSSARP